MERDVQAAQRDSAATATSAAPPAMPAMPTSMAETARIAGTTRTARAINATPPSHTTRPRPAYAAPAAALVGS